MSGIKKETRQKILLEYIPMAVTFIGIVACAIIFKQQVIKTLPVCFSLAIMLFNSRANRIGFLLGATNSVIYIIGYFREGLYGTVISTIFGILVQVTSFFLWKKNAYKQATRFRKLGWKGRTLLVGMLLAAWSTTSFVLWKMNGTEVVLDGLLMVIGFLLPLLQMLAIIESLPLSLLNIFINLVMWLRIIFIGGAFENTTYLISGLYNLYMTIRMTRRWIVLYKEQRTQEMAIKQEKL